jgi:hypothetical protein
MLDRSIDHFGKRQSLARRSPGHEDKDRELISAGYPPRYRTVFNLYAWKVFIAAMLFLVGLVNAVIIGPGFLPSHLDLAS